MKEPRPHFTLGAGAPSAKNTLICPHELRLHEQIAEDRMRRIRPGNSEDHFGVTCQLDDALRMGMVRNSHPSQLNVVFPRNADFRVDLEVAVALAILRTRTAKNTCVLSGWAQGGLISYRPEFSRHRIAQINKGSPTITRGILAPAGNRQITPTTVAASGIADSQVITSVGQEVDFGNARIGGIEDSHLLFLPIQLPGSI